MLTLFYNPYKATLVVLLYVRLDILLTCGKYLHVCVISLKGEVWAHNFGLRSHTQF